MRQAHHQFKVYSDLKVLVLIHLNHLSSVTLRGKCSSLWHRHNRCSEWWNFLFSGFQLTASSSFKVTRTVSSASDIACFIMRKETLKKIQKKKDPEGGFYSWFERTNEICSYRFNRTQTFLVKNGFSSLFIKKWNTITKMVLVRLLLSSWRKKKSFKTINGDVSIRDWLLHNVRNKKQNNLCSAGPYAFSDTNNG